MNKFAQMLLFLLSLLPLVAEAQVIHMPTSGNHDTTLASVTLRDDGQGPGGSYSGHAQSTYTFRCTQPGSVYQIKWYRLDDLTGDEGRMQVIIYDGDSADGNRVIYRNGYWWNYYMFYSSSEAVTVTFRSDDDTPSGGWRIELCEAGGMAPCNVRDSLLGQDSALITWEQPEGTNYTWAILYGETGNREYWSGLCDTDVVWTTIYSDTDHVVIPIAGIVNYLVYPLTNTPCGHGAPGTFCPCLWVEFETRYDPDSLRVVWQPDPRARYHHFRGAGLDTLVRDTILAIPYSCEGGDQWWFDINGANCNFDTMVCNNWWDWRPSTPCRIVQDYGFHGANDSSIFVHWRDYEWLDTALGFVVYWRYAHEPADSNRAWDTLLWNDMIQDYNGRPRYDWEWYWADTLTGLRPHTNYVISVKRFCQNSSESCLRELWAWTTIGGCLDYTKIWDLDDVRLTWGYYGNPYRSEVRDTIWDFDPNRWGYDHPEYGNLFFNGSDRHQAHCDTTEIDWNTYDYTDGSALRKVPEGKPASMRLGNDGRNAEAESITYTYVVDTTDHDLLVLQYALVMQNPDHTTANQPHFTLELLDTAGVLMDSVCCHADFVAGANTSGQGWHTMDDGITQWKDWTTVGIDLVPYHGQTIHVRLTNKDCAEGGHYAYAYFTMHCDNRRIVLVNKCDSAAHIHMQAPLGFDYLWYPKSDPTRILGTAYDQLVPIDTNIYVCRCSFVGKPQCYFEMECVSIDVRPHAQLSCDYDSCGRTARFYGSGWLEIDSTYGAYTPQLADSIYWMLDGQQHFGDTLAVQFTQNRTYSPTLFVHLSGSQCVDTVGASIQVSNVYRREIVMDTHFCEGTTYGFTYNLYLVEDSLTPIYTHTWTHQPAPAPGSWNQLAWRTGDICPDTARHPLVVHPLHNDTLHATVCQGESFGLGFPQTTPGFYTRSLTSSWGCDSVVNLDLAVQTYSDTTLEVYLCTGYYYEFGGNRYSSTGTFLDTLRTALGCDSLRYELTLSMGASLVESDTALCVGDTLLFGEEALTSPGEYRHLFTNAVGCDSVVLVRLAIHHTFRGITYDTLCEGDVAWFEGQWIGVDTSLTVHHSTPEGCDSSRTLVLTVRANSFTPLDTALCHGHRVEVGWHSYGETGLYRDTLCNALQCDSVVELRLEVAPPPCDTLWAAICPGAEYPWNGATYWLPGTYLAMGRDAEGCDTLTALVLELLPEYRDTILLTLQPESDTLPGTYTEHLYTLAGCDSILVLIAVAPEPPVGTGEDPAAASCALSLYPNPTTGLVTLDSPVPILEVGLYDPQGRRVALPPNRPTQLDLGPLPAGLYLVRVTTGHGTSTFRIIKK